MVIKLLNKDSGYKYRLQDPNGILTSLNYYPATGYLQSIARDPLGINAVTAFTYDNFGTLNQVTDAEGRTANYDFNELGWLVQETNPLSAVTLYFYDKNGNVETITRKFNGITGILMKYHPIGEKAKTTAQVLIVSELIESDEDRNELDPLCTISVSFDENGKYYGVGFGIIPEGKISVNR